jgi:5'-deoxynucleotidase YfbR-like HD superfamily hydrolase
VSNLACGYALSGVPGLFRPESPQEAAKIGLRALLHDASEAYITDLNSPAKSLLPEYKVMEDRISSAIYKKYGVEYDEEPVQIKYADNTMLVAEAQALLKETDFSKWVDNNYDQSVKYMQIPLTPRQAEASYLTRFASMLQMYIQKQKPDLKVIDGGKKEEKADAIS